MNEHFALPQWASLVNACRIAMRDYETGLHVLLHGCEPDGQQRPPISRVAVAELVGSLARDGRVEVGINDPGSGAPIIVPPSDPAFRLISWSYSGEIDGAARNPTNHPVGVMPAQCGRNILINLHDLVTVLGLATPATSPEEEFPVDGLTFIEGNAAVLDFPAALRMLEGFRDVWEWIVSPVRNPNLDGWSLPKTPAAIMAAFFMPGSGWPCGVFHRDGETWKRTPHDANLCFCDDAGTPVGLMLDGRGQARRIGLDARSYLGALNRLRSEMAEMSERRRAERQAEEAMRRRSAEQQAAKAAEVDRAEKAERASAHVREREERQRRIAVVRSVADAMKTATPSQAAETRAPKARR